MEELVDLPLETFGAVRYQSAPPQAQKQKNSPPVLAVITLQKASGSWDLTDQLVSLCGTSRDVLINGCPNEITVDTGEGKLLWATALALVLLMGKFLDQKDEWEMIAEKGSKWMKKNLPAGVKYRECPGGGSDHTWGSSKSWTVNARSLIKDCKRSFEFRLNLN